MWGPGNWKNNQEISVYHQSSTYRTSGVALEGTGVDLDICAIKSIDCSALLSWMSRTCVSLQGRLQFAWSQGVPSRARRPPIAAGVWYKHLDGGLPVLGVRFEGIKSVRSGLLGVQPRRPLRTSYEPIVLWEALLTSWDWDAVQ
jgi:hypothetical protein